MFRTLAMRLAPAAVAVLLVALPTVVAAQASEQGQKHGGMHDESDATMDCQQMMKMKEQMQAKQQQMQTALDEMVAHMNASSGQKQQQAMAVLLTKLVENRSAMQGMMTKMEPKMMRHMMQHMHSGDMGGMSDCPMMKSMHGDGDRANSESKSEHSEHQ